MPAQAAGAPPQPPRYTMVTPWYTMMDVKTLSGANELYHERDRTRGTRAAAPAGAGRRRFL